MKFKFVQKYFTIVLLLASFMGSFHHHKDGLQHSDCQICTLVSSIANADTPVKAVYLTELSLTSEAILTPLQTLTSLKLHTYNARSPPKIIS